MLAIFRYVNKRRVSNDVISNIQLKTLCSYMKFTIDSTEYNDIQHNFENVKLYF